VTPAFQPEESRFQPEEQLNKMILQYDFGQKTEVSALNRLVILLGMHASM
jgi:hypothetical protein